MHSVTGTAPAVDRSDNGQAQPPGEPGLTAYAAAGLAVLTAGLLTVIAGRRLRLRPRQA